ncbi:hypothetical protein NI464_03465, partial [Acinetobacter lwoffii]|nr:hypothetical protein [Acinetobacter lwoffii]
PQIMHECQEIWSANINQKEDHFLIYERDLILAGLFDIQVKSNLLRLISNLGRLIVLDNL